MKKLRAADASILQQIFLRKMKIRNHLKLSKYNLI